MAKIGIDARLWNETGVGRYIRNLVHYLQEIDTKNEYTLFVLSKDLESVKSKVQNEKWEIIAVDIRWHSLEEQQKFPKILEKEQLDLMHFPYFSVPIAYKRPFVVTIHDLILHHFPTGKASTLPRPVYYAKHVGYKFVLSQAAKKAKKIIAVSEATKEQIIADLGIQPNKIVVTYEGVDPDIHNKENFHAVTTGYFLYVGNVYPHKNAERLLEAFKEFKNTAISDTKLIFVGRDDYFYQELKKRIHELDLEASVKVFTNISDDALASLYHHAIAVVVPSLMEGFGLPGLEAMAHNCLVIASQIPSLKEIYQDAALYVDPTSRESIAQALKKVYFMGIDEKDMLRKKGQDQVKKFSWKEMAIQTLEVYTTVLSDTLHHV